ncbi:hypothetical protein HDV02_004959 [Globomyces sp. JEL0801]|nr:hypothetical protein HDV02_004959 [Globomyces sp. JEL0801]
MEAEIPINFIHKNSITVAATSSAFFSVLAGYPFDSIKTRMQAFKYPNTISCIKSTYYYEGIAGFYRGVVPLLATSTTLRAMSWNLYTSSKSVLVHPEFNNSNGVLGRVMFPCFLAGGFTGVTLSVLAAPIEFIKVQRQLQQVHATSGANQPTANSLGSWFLRIVREKGFRGLYTGYSIHAPLEFLGCGSYFGLYELFKYYGPSNNGVPLPWVSLAGGGAAGALSWALVFPMDV